MHVLDTECKRRISYKLLQKELLEEWFETQKEGLLSSASAPLFFNET